MPRNPDIRVVPHDPGAAESIARAAAEWLVSLSDCGPGEAPDRHAAFAAWKDADPRHAAAAARMEAFIGRVQGLRAGGAKPARAALEATAAPARRGPRLRRAGRALLLAGLLAAPGWLAWQTWPPAVLLADIRTGTAGWESRVLEDGTRIALNGATAVNLRFDPRQRLLELVRGEILVEVAGDPVRPFLVKTPHGVMRAVGTRFIVSRDDSATVLTVLESKVAVQHCLAAPAAGGGEAIIVSAGERIRLTGAGIGRSEAIDVRSIADAWASHRLVVQEQPLPDVLDILARHRPGYLRYDRDALAGFHVSAVLPLDDTDRALQLLLASFPIRVRSLTPWLVMVDKAPAP